MNADVANKLASIARVMVKGAELPEAFDAQFGAGSFERITLRLDDELFQKSARATSRESVDLPRGVVGAMEDALRELRKIGSVEHWVPDTLKFARDILAEAMIADRELSVAREELREAQRQRDGTAVPAKRRLEAAQTRRGLAWARVAGVL